MGNTRDTNDCNWYWLIEYSDWLISIALSFYYKQRTVSHNPFDPILPLILPLDKHQLPSHLIFYVANYPFDTLTSCAFYPPYPLIHFKNLLLSMLLTAIYVTSVPSYIPHSNKHHPKHFQPFSPNCVQVKPSTWSDFDMHFLLVQTLWIYWKIWIRLASVFISYLVMRALYSLHK